MLLFLVSNLLFLDLAKDSSALLSLTLVVLCGYQSLSPDVFLRVGFSPAKLLPPFPASHDIKESASHDNNGGALSLALQINISAYEKSWNKVLTS